MKFILVGKCFSDETSGPGPVMMALKQVLEDKYPEESKVIFWNEENNKQAFLLSVIRQLFEKEPCLINVHTSGFLIPVFILLMSKFFRKHKYYLTLHGIYEIESTFTGIKSKRNVCLERLLCRTFPNIICVSEQQRKDIKRIYGRTDGVLVIPNGTDAISYRSQNVPPYKDRLEIVTLGGLKKRKGIHEALELIRFLVHENGLNVHLSIYGAEEGTQTAEWLLNWCNDNQLSQNVSYHGLIQDKEAVYQIISNAHFQVCLSGYDTFNIAIAESLVLGCPCICSDRCGASYLIRPYQSGLVVSLSDDNLNNCIYDYIFSFINDSQKLDRIHCERNYYTKTLSWEYICAMYTQLCSE